ncbi:hypothetical protein G7Y89_g4627 [Cudoniella acicularis]|uniref:Uncharacterized protein n=1 Tax=Cudoniella acicularis TaxID=354080 RepID=A0A8H4RP15_9HELO|nr:hypothetical protein G7Y89_g4627 [Cudoniella acicularis]
MATPMVLLAFKHKLDPENSSTSSAWYNTAALDFTTLEQTIYQKIIVRPRGDFCTEVNIRISWDINDDLVPIVTPIFDWTSQRSLDYYRTIIFMNARHFILVSYASPSRPRT